MMGFDKIKYRRVNREFQFLTDISTKKLPDDYFNYCFTNYSLNCKLVKFVLSSYLKFVTNHEYPEQISST